jgi:hypothetical protein
MIAFRINKIEVNTPLVWLLLGVSLQFFKPTPETNIWHIATRTGRQKIWGGSYFIAHAAALHPTCIKIRDNALVMVHWQCSNFLFTSGNQVSE